jgi:diaminohydroxyphosphoribosylaminopyrimidine deaminase/5-amino-6-(5-phosphoribosylamino)uracil reductase
VLEVVGKREDACRHISHRRVGELLTARRKPSAIVEATHRHEAQHLVRTGASRLGAMSGLREEAELWLRVLALRGDGAATMLPELPRQAAVGLAALLPLYLPLAQRPRDRSCAIAHLGQSLDGRIATAAGASRWVTGEADLLHTHRMRALADAVVVGAGTVRHDDPQLTVRRCVGEQPVRVVIDSERRLGPDYRVFQDGAAPSLVLAAADRVGPGERLGQAEILPLPRGGDGALPPVEIRRALAMRGLRLLFIEGGGITISRFLTAGALDRLQLTVAPIILGSGRPSLSLPEIAEPCQGLRPRLRRFSLGDDMLYECIFRD